LRYLKHFCKSWNKELLSNATAKNLFEIKKIKHITFDYNSAAWRANTTLICRIIVPPLLNPAEWFFADFIGDLFKILLQCHNIPN
jgi:hypothetical protein